jgi:hypothetical protein
MHSRRLTTVSGVSAEVKGKGQRGEAAPGSSEAAIGSSGDAEVSEGS